MTPKMTPAKPGVLVADYGLVGDLVTVTVRALQPGCSNVSQQYPGQGFGFQPRYVVPAIERKG